MIGFVFICLIFLFFRDIKKYKETLAAQPAMQQITMSDQLEVAVEDPVG